VAAGQPSGTLALTVLAVWMLLLGIVAAAVPVDPDDLTFWTVWGYLDQIVGLAAAIVAVVAIRRAAVVPRPWNRAPLWALVAVAGMWVLTQAFAVAVGQNAPGALLLLYQLSGIVSFLALLGLGILAIVLGLRADPRPAVPIYLSGADGTGSAGS